jgi:hypothetical protein
MKTLKESKKMQSDMVSYVLLIVIAMAISVGVYSWLKWYAPSQNQAQTCSEDVAMVINDYNCSNQIIYLSIENKGFFSIDGFFARGTNDSSKLPVSMLTNLDSLTNIPGRYDFGEKFISGQIKTARFDYAPISPIRRIQLQPFVIADKGQLLNCPNVVDINIDSINGC